jgi:hypothetical protein
LGLILGVCGPGPVNFRLRRHKVISQWYMTLLHFT